MGEEILAYIPQRPPFVMVSVLVSTNEKMTATTFTIPEDNLFVADGFFTEPGLIENMAQTAAASTGYKASKEGAPAPVGFFAALKNVHIIKLPRAKETITTEVTFLQELMNFHLVTGRVLLDGEEIASCEFKIFVSPQPDKNN